MKLIIYFADGFAWKYVEEVDLMPGFWTVLRPLETILGYSSAIVPCLISGKYPRDTGVWTEYYRSDRPQTMLERVLVSSSLLRTPANLTRLVLFRIARRLGLPAVHGLRVPLELAHFFQRHDMDYRRFPPVKLAVRTLDQVFQEAGLRFEFRYLSAGPTIGELERLRSKIDDVDVFFYYDSSVDAEGHHLGAAASKLTPEIDRIEAFLSEAWPIVANPDGELLLFSDHGMTDVRKSYHLFRALSSFRLGRDYLVFLDSTFGRFWFPNRQTRDQIVSALSDAPGQFLDAGEKHRYGIDFDDDRYGQEILVADEGVVFHPNYISPSMISRQRYPDRATHGYRPEFSSSYGLFAYRGSRWGGTTPDPVRAVDVFGVITGIIDRAEERHT